MSRGSVRVSVIVWLVAAVGSAVSTQEEAPPELTAEQQIIIELNNEVERLANDLQNVLEQEASAQVKFNTLTRAYNMLRLSLIREQSTPAPEGFVYDWTIDPETGQRRGLVPTVPVDDPETSTEESER